MHRPSRLNQDSAAIDAIQRQQREALGQRQQQPAHGGGGGAAFQGLASSFAGSSPAGSLLNGGGGGGEGRGAAPQEQARHRCSPAGTQADSHQNGLHRSDYKKMPFSFLQKR